MGFDSIEELLTKRGAVVRVGSGVKACRCTGHRILLRLVNVRCAVLRYRNNAKSQSLPASTQVGEGVHLHNNMTLIDTQVSQDA